MNKTHIRFSPSILKRLGEELNLGFDQGILELVKNAYDADALTCTVELLEVNAPGGMIHVHDTGVGMTDEQIINGWLVLGESQKKSNEPTNLGRLPAGNKGLGRLAALRMGNRADLSTRPASQPGAQYSITLDWELFDAAKSVDEVDLDVENKSIPADTKSSTDIIISGVRDKLSRIEVKRLARGMLLLADPFGDTPSGFQPILKAKEFEDLEKLVERRYFKDSEFHLHAQVGEDGKAWAVVKDFHGKEIYRADHKLIRLKRATDSYNLPAVTFDLWVFSLDAKTFSTRNITLGEVRAWLAEFGGVHLYMNGIRVTPYGNPGDDWLNLNLARVQHPEFRPGTNTSIGRVSIRDTSYIFTQKTDRTGLIENDAYFELKQFTKEALDWMARERLSEAEVRRANTRVSANEGVKKERETVEATIEALPIQQKEIIRQSFKRYDRVRDIETEVLRKDIILYRTLGTVGIVAAVFAHETTRPIDLIERNARIIKVEAARILGTDYDSNLKEPLELILAQSALMGGFQELTLGFVEREKRRNTRVDVHKAIYSTFHNFRTILDERHVTFKIEKAKGSPYFRGSSATLEVVIANFIVNSVRAFGTTQIGERHILVKTQTQDKSLSIRFLDNGPGINELDTKDIWSPGESGYEDGTGLGLTIVRDTVKDLGGSVSVLSHGELSGAEFIINIPILGF